MLIFQTDLCIIGENNGNKTKEDSNMNPLPTDPVILLSYVNTKLRDECANLDDFCDKYQVDRVFLCDKLSAINYRYNSVTNQFV